MLRFKKIMSVLFSVLIIVTTFSFVTASATSDGVSSSTRPTEATASTYVEATKPQYNTNVTVTRADDEQDVYVENQPFDNTTNVAIIVCAVEGGIICVFLLMIILLLVIRILKENKSKIQY